MNKEISKQAPKKALRKALVSRWAFHKSKKMTDTDKKQLEYEIRHLFESGENELRIFNMVVDFIEKRYVPRDNGASLATCKKCGSFIFTADGKRCVSCHEPCH